MMPGITNCPEASMSLASAGIETSVPTAAIFPSRMRTVPFSIVPPVTVRIVPPRTAFDLLSVHEPRLDLRALVEDVSAGDEEVRDLPRLETSQPILETEDRRGVERERFNRPLSRKPGGDRLPQVRGGLFGFLATVRIEPEAYPRFLAHSGCRRSSVPELEAAERRFRLRVRVLVAVGPFETHEDRGLRRGKRFGGGT